MLPEKISFKQQDSTSFISFLSSVKSSLLLRYFKCLFSAYQVTPYSAITTDGELHINNTLCGNVFWSLCLWMGQDDMSDKGSSCITIQCLPIQIASKYFFKHGLHWGIISILISLWSSAKLCYVLCVYLEAFLLPWSRTILLHDCFRNSPAQWGSSCSIFFLSTTEHFSKILFESSVEFFWVWKSLCWTKTACSVATTNGITFH